MFAPRPRDAQIQVAAEVEREDGRLDLWEFPQMERMGYLERYRRERFRRWANDALRLDERSDLWAPAARYVALTSARSGRPPRQVALIRRWAPIPPVGSPEPPRWSSARFFTYAVKPEDLDAAR
jgi:hypothetical protein